MWESGQTVLVTKPVGTISAGTTGRLEWHAKTQGIACLTIWECGEAHRFNIPLDCLQPIVMPHQHPAGTSKDQHVSLRRALLGALEQAQSALEELEPQGPDFWPTRRPEALEDANEQHARRMRTLRLLQIEVRTEMEAIRDYWPEQAAEDSDD